MSCAGRGGAGLPRGARGRCWKGPGTLRASPGAGAEPWPWGGAARAALRPLLSPSRAAAAAEVRAGAASRVVIEGSSCTTRCVVEEDNKKMCILCTLLGWGHSVCRVTVGLILGLASRCCHNTTIGIVCSLWYAGQGLFTYVVKLIQEYI